MPGDEFNVFATFGQQVRVAIGARRILASTRWPSPTITHYRWHTAFTVAATVAVLATVAIAATATEDQSTSSSPVRFVCSTSKRVESLAASGSWQEVEANVTDEQFKGECAVKVNFASNTTEASYSYPEWKTALLVKVYKLQLRPARSECRENYLTLKIYSLLQGQRQADICNTNAVDALYIWVNEPIQLYMYVYAPTEYRASFSVASVAVLPVDVCQNSSYLSEELRVHQELYVFAPDLEFVQFLQQITACSSSKQLRLAAASPFNALNVTVLAAPTNSSCWSLWLDELRISSAGDRSFVVGANVAVLYWHNDSTSGCSSSEIQRGFTLKFNAVAIADVTVTVILGSTELLGTAATSVTTGQSVFTMTQGGSEVKGTSEAVAIGSAVAAVLGVTGVVLIAALLIIRRRRRIQRPHKSSSQAAPSVLGLANAVSARHANQSIHPYAELSPYPRSPHGAIFSASIDAAAPTVGGGSADIVMADNDLYDTAFGS